MPRKGSTGPVADRIVRSSFQLGIGMRSRAAECRATGGKVIVMPKMKTRKSVAKRFKLTATGKIKRGSASRGHLLSSKSRKRKPHLRRGALVSGPDYKRIIHALVGC